LKGPESLKPTLMVSLNKIIPFEDPLLQRRGKANHISQQPQYECLQTFKSTRHSDTHNIGKSKYN